MDRTGAFHVKGNKPESRGQILHIFFCIWNLNFLKRHESRRGTIYLERVGGHQKEGWGQERVMRGRV
jgi:hypothetical protein